MNSRPVLRTVDFHGTQISVEFDKGDTKRGVGDYGEVWENRYDTAAYGEIPNSRTLADGEGLDVYIREEGFDAPMVFVVHQLKRNGTYDEPKAFLGYQNMGAAIADYLRYGPKWGFGGCDEMTVDQFLHGYLASCRKI
jgi:hypothetical protein